MAFDISGMSGVAMGWLSTIIYWIIGLITAIIMALLVLFTRKKKKLKYPIIQIIDLGSNKAGFWYTKAGWIKSKSFLGLYDYGGEEKMMTKEGKEIQNASSEDFQEIEGKRGLVVQEKSDDPKILVPINRTVLDTESKAIINSIAPADYRDASVKIMQKTEQETSNRFSQFLTQALPYIMVVGFIVSLIMIIQYAKHSQAESWSQTLEAIKMAYANRGAVIESLAP